MRLELVGIIIFTFLPIAIHSQSNFRRRLIRQREREVFLTSDDFARARRFPPKDLPRNGKIAPSRRLFEGCIKKLSQSKLQSFVSTADVKHRDQGSGKSALFADPIPDRYQLWPNGRVPYAISSQFSLTMRDLIAAAISDFHKYTCIKFARRQSSDASYVFITPGAAGEGCWSDTVGRDGGRQILNLEEPGCSQKGTVIHELLHVVGMFHEHSRSDRDRYITIKWENIAPSQQIQFSKHSIPLLEALNTPYDYNSVMHYPRDAFSWNDRDTIITRPPGRPIGQRSGFSQIDAEEVNKLYCPGRVGGARPRPNRPRPQPEFPIDPTDQIIDIDLPPPTLPPLVIPPPAPQIVQPQPFFPRPPPPDHLIIRPRERFIPHRPRHGGEQRRGPWSGPLNPGPGRRHYGPQLRRLVQHPAVRQLANHPIARQIGRAIMRHFG